MLDYTYAESTHVLQSMQILRGVVKYFTTISLHACKFTGAKGDGNQSYTTLQQSSTPRDRNFGGRCCSAGPRMQSGLWAWFLGKSERNYPTGEDNVTELVLWEGLLQKKPPIPTHQQTLRDNSSWTWTRRRIATIVTRRSETTTTDPPTNDCAVPPQPFLFGDRL